MSTVLVRYRIARTGQPVPSDTPAPPDYVPWPHAPITWTRTEGDYGPGIVRPRDSITTRADEHGEGAVYLAPGRYRITLPSRESYDRTVSADLPEIDLSALLAGGGVEPDDPQYPTLAAYVVDQIGVALEDQLDAIDEAVETAEESATTAQEARDAAVSAQTVTEAARDAAIEAQGLAEGARDAAEGYATTAGTARDQAVAAQGAAESAASAASSHALAAAGAASAAEGSASSASGSASAAAGSATAAQTAQGHAEDARDAAQGYAEDAQQAAQATAADRLAVSQDRQAIESEQAARLAAIQTAGDTQVGRVEDEGDTQVQRVIDAGDELAIVVPDPAPQPDGRVLSTWGGDLVYDPTHAIAVALTGANAERVKVYETGQRDVVSNTSAYGRLTDSGHEWIATEIPGRPAPIARYSPSGYMTCEQTPKDNISDGIFAPSLIDVADLSNQRWVEVYARYTSAPNHTRWVVLSWVGPDDYLTVGVLDYRIDVVAVTSGSPALLAQYGSVDTAAPGRNAWRLRASAEYRHSFISPINRVVVVHLNGQEVLDVPLDAAHAHLVTNGARIGFASSYVTYIYGIAAGDLV